MNYVLCDKLKKLTPYDPIEGDYKIRLDANESFINLNDSIKQQISEAVWEIDYNRYPDPYATKACKAFADFYNVDPALVTASNGSDEIIAVIIGSFLQKGEKLLTFSQDFSMYKLYGEIYEADNVICPKENLRLTLNEAEKLIKEQNIKAVIFSNPCNPTSLGENKENVIKFIKNTEALVILDEAYMDFWNESLLDIVNDFDNLIILKTCSKAFGLAAIRLGFAVANQRLTTAIRAAKSPYNVNSVTQKIGEIVLSNKKYLKECIASIIDMKNYLYTLLTQNFGDKFEIINSNTNFVYFKPMNPKEIFEKLLSKGIAIRYMGDYLRISAGSKDEINQLITVLKDIVQI